MLYFRDVLLSVSIKQLNLLTCLSTDILLQKRVCDRVGHGQLVVLRDSKRGWPFKMSSHGMVVATEYKIVMFPYRVRVTSQW